MTNQAIKFIDLLNDINYYDWKLALYCQGGHPYSLDSSCWVLDPNLEDDSNHQKLVKENNLSYILSIHIIQDILSNLKQQKQLVTDEEMLRAFKFYMEHDAFINMKIQ